jgi:hypothetical protein
MVEISESPAEPRAASVAPELAAFIAIVGAAWVGMGLRQPSDELLLPIARAIHSLSPPAEMTHATSD